MGKIRQRKTRSGGVSWYIDLRPHGRLWSRHGVPFETRTHAARVLMEIQKELARGRPADEVLDEYRGRRSKKHLVTHYLDLWLEEKERQVRTGEITARYLQTLTWHTHHHMHPFFERRRSGIYDLSLPLLQDWMAGLVDQGLSANSRRTHLGQMAIFLNWLHRDRELLDKKPRLPRVKVPEREPAILPIERQHAIIRAIPEWSRGIFWAMALGIRPGEARAFRVSDYKRGWLSVTRGVQGPACTAPVGPTKTGRARTVPCSTQLETWIREHIDPRSRLKGALLFPSSSGRMWSQSGLEKAWAAACDRIDVPRGPLYESTRHSFATDALRRGTSERVVQELLGHVPGSRSTARYARLAKRVAFLDALRPEDQSPEAVRSVHEE